MQSSIFRKADISRRFAYAECWLFFHNLKFIWIILSSSRHFFSFSGEELAVVFGDGILWRLAIVRLTNHILWHVSAGTDRFSQIKMLLHTFITNLFVFIISIRKSMRLILVYFWCFGHVGEWLLNKVVIFGTWGDSLRSHLSKIKLLSVADTFFVDFVVVAGFVD